MRRNLSVVENHPLLYKDLHHDENVPFGYAQEEESFEFQPRLKLTSSSVSPHALPGNYIVTGNWYIELECCIIFISSLQFSYSVFYLYFNLQSWVWFHRLSDIR